MCRSHSPLAADRGNRLPVPQSGHCTRGSQPVPRARLTATSSSSPSSSPSSPLPLSYSCSKFHNPIHHSTDIRQLVTVVPSFPSPLFNPSWQRCLPWSTHPAGSCFSLPAPATASSRHNQHLLRAQTDKSSSQIHPLCVTDISSHHGEPRVQ